MRLGAHKNYPSGDNVITAWIQYTKPCTTKLLGKPEYKAWVYAGARMWDTDIVEKKTFDTYLELRRFVRA